MRIFSYLFLILAQTMGATNIVASKYLLSSFTVLFLLSIRFLFATLLLLILHFSLKGFSLGVYFKHLTKYDWVYIFLSAISAGILFNLLMLCGLFYTSANVAGVILSGLPAMVVLLSWIFLKKRLNLKRLLCLGLATVGLLIISTAQLSITNIHNSLWGDLIILLSLIPEASYYIFNRTSSTKLPVFLMSALINGINASIIFPIFFLHKFQWTFSVNQSFALIALVLSSALFYVFWYFGSKNIDISLTSLSTAFMPIATLIIAQMVLNEKILFNQLVGMGLIILSVIVNEVSMFYLKAIIQHGNNFFRKIIYGF